MEATLLSTLTLTVHTRKYFSMVIHISKLYISLHGKVVQQLFKWSTIGSKLSAHKFSIVFDIILCFSFTDGREAAFLNYVINKKQLFSMDISFIGVSIPWYTRKWWVKRGKLQISMKTPYVAASYINAHTRA